METVPALDADPDDTEHIAALRERLAALDREREKLRARIQRIEHGSGLVPQGAPRAPAQKTALFRSLFAGRPDVYALRWSSTRTGRSGYSPACANEWVRDVCRKPEVQCAAELRVTTFCMFCSTSRHR